eukprot:COSAG06_NODE_715_length_12863_cov_38.702569_5_plen_1506_part_00
MRAAGLTLLLLALLQTGLGQTRRLTLLVRPSDLVPAATRVSVAGCEDLACVAREAKRQLGLDGPEHGLGRRIVLTPALVDGLNAEPVPYESLDEIDDVAKVQLWPAPRPEPECEQLLAAERDALLREQRAAILAAQAAVSSSGQDAGAAHELAAALRAELDESKALAQRQAAELASARAQATSADARAVDADAASRELREQLTRALAEAARSQAYLGSSGDRIATLEAELEMARAVTRRAVEDCEDGAAKRVATACTEEEQLIDALKLQQAQQRAAADECAASLLAMQSSTSEAAVAAETERRKEADQCTASLLAKEAALSEAGRAREQDVTACETACATQTQALAKEVEMRADEAQQARAELAAVQKQHAQELAAAAAQASADASAGECVCLQEECEECPACAVCAACPGCPEAKSMPVECPECPACQRCQECDECQQCQECQTCPEPTTCEECVACPQQNECEQCEVCPAAKECEQCERCEACPDVTACEQCEQCEACEDVKECEQCRECEDCQTSSDCPACQVCEQCRECEECEQCRKCQECPDCSSVTGCPTGDGSSQHLQDGAAAARNMFMNVADRAQATYMNAPKLSEVMETVTDTMETVTDTVTEAAGTMTDTVTEAAKAVPRPTVDLPTVEMPTMPAEPISVPTLPTMPAWMVPDVETMRQKVTNAAYLAVVGAVILLALKCAIAIAEGIAEGIAVVAMVRTLSRQLSLLAWPTRGAAEEAVPPSSAHSSAAAGLSDALQKMKPSELAARARQSGVRRELLEQADDADDRKAALIDLIVSHEAKESEWAPRPEDLAKLRGMKVSELKKMAQARNVPARALDEAEDAADMKETIIQLIVSQAHRQAKEQEEAQEDAIKAEQMSFFTDVFPQLQDMVTAPRGVEGLRQRARQEGLNPTQIAGCTTAQDMVTLILEHKQARWKTLKSSPRPSEAVPPRKEPQPQPQPEPEPEPEPEPQTLAELEASLQQMKPTELKARATISGVPHALIEEADEANDRKAAFIRLIVMQERGSTGDMASSTATTGDWIAVGAVGCGLVVFGVPEPETTVLCLVAGGLVWTGWTKLVGGTGLGSGSTTQAADPAVKSVAEQKRAEMCAGLEQTLTRMKLSQLKKRAKASGVDDTLVGQADDADDPKANLISLIVSAEIRDPVEAGAAGIQQIETRLDTLSTEIEKLETSRTARPQKQKTLSIVKEIKEDLALVGDMSPEYQELALSPRSPRTPSSHSPRSSPGSGYDDGAGGASQFRDVLFAVREAGKSVDTSSQVVLELTSSHLSWTPVGGDTASEFPLCDFLQPETGGGSSGRLWGSSEDVWITAQLLTNIRTPPVPITLTFQRPGGSSSYRTTERDQVFQMLQSHQRKEKVQVLSPQRAKSPASPRNLSAELASGTAEQFSPFQLTLGPNRGALPFSRNGHGMMCLTDPPICVSQHDGPITALCDHERGVMEQGTGLHYLEFLLTQIGSEGVQLGANITHATQPPTRSSTSNHSHSLYHIHLHIIIII